MRGKRTKGPHKRVGSAFSSVPTHFPRAGGRRQTTSERCFARTNVCSVILALFSRKRERSSARPVGRRPRRGRALRRGIVFKRASDADRWGGSGLLHVCLAPKERVTHILSSEKKRNLCEISPRRSREMARVQLLLLIR